MYPGIGQLPESFGGDLLALEIIASNRLSNAKKRATLYQVLDIRILDGHKFVEALLAKCVLSESDVENLVLSALGSNQSLVIDSFAQKSLLTHKIVKNMFMRKCAVDGDLEKMRAFLQDESHIIIESYRLDACTEAAARGHLPILRLLLQDYTLSQQEREDFVSEASSKEHRDVLEFLLEQGPIDDRCKDYVIIGYAKYGHLDMIRSFLEGGHVMEPHHRVEAYENAVDNGHLAILRLLLGERTLSQREREQFVLRASSKGHRDVLEFLLEQGPIGDDCKNRIIIECAEYGYAEIIRSFLEGGHLLSESNSRSAFTAVAKHGHVAVLRLLLEGFYLSRRDREGFVLEASSKGHRDVLEFLLQQGPISLHARDSAMTQAGRDEHAEPGSREVILDLLGMAQILPDAPRAAGVAAGDHQARADDSESLYTTFADVKADPLSFLERVSAQFPTRVVLTDTPQAIDLGGISKQFITTLIEALQEKEINGLKIITTNAKLLPTAEEKNAPYMTLIGRFFSALYKRNSHRYDKFIIGNLFHLRFFDLVKIALEEGLFEDKLKQVALVVASIEPDLTLAKNALIAPTGLANPDDESNLQTNLAAYREAMASAEANPEDNFKGYLQAAAAFASGLSAEFEAVLKARESEDLMKQMQGESITNAKVRASCLIVDTDPVFQEHANWIIEKIDTAPLDWLEQFIFAITGNYNLSSNLKIKIYLSQRGAFEIHTCFASLDIPIHLESKQTFLDQFEKAIRDVRYTTA